MESAKEKFGLRNFYKKHLSQFSSPFRSQKTYIIPTRLGLSYSLLCFVLLLMAMAYGNNLVFIICFSLTCMGMILAKNINSTIDNVEILSVEMRTAFAEPHQNLTIHIKNRSSIPLEEISISLQDKKSLKMKTRLDPQETQIIEYPWNIGQRGYHKLPTVVVSSEFPSGLFHAWKILNPKSEVLAYPARIGSIRFPFAHSQSQDSIGVIREIRDYRPGDSPKRIHWRSLAKNQQLRTLVHESESDRSCLLKWEELHRLDLESRISQMSLWIDIAEKNAYDWTLYLPKKVIPRHSHPEAYHQALKTLALWETEN